MSVEHTNVVNNATLKRLELREERVWDLSGEALLNKESNENDVRHRALKMYLQGRAAVLVFHGST